MERTEIFDAGVYYNGWTIRIYEMENGEIEMVVSSTHEEEDTYTLAQDTLIYMLNQYGETTPSGDANGLKRMLDAVAKWDDYEDDIWPEDN